MKLNFIPQEVILQILECLSLSLFLGIILQNL